MKRVLIRKGDCGHWVIYGRINIDKTSFLYVELAHLDDFEEVLLVINGESGLVYAD